jgi:DNA-binding LacI/PurR family transcriptional regulator/signal transduction histidine kinase
MPETASGKTRRAAHRVVGVFTAQLDDAYQVALWRGIERRARERGLGIVTFAGHRIHSPVTAEAAANFSYDIGGPRAVDGLIIVASTIATFLRREQVEALFSSHRGVPLVSVGPAPHGIPAVAADGAHAMAELARHLVVHHGRRRFALITGPEGHPEAEERERALRRTLAELGVDFDERLSVRGSFLRESGAAAAERLLAAGARFDALLCMNDGMALGALEVLRRAGARIPDDIAVTGFDGIEAGRAVTPPLTTVIQPFDELGDRAVDLLIDLMDGGAARDVLLPCAPALRRSCGCVPLRAEAPPPGEEEQRAMEALAGLAAAGDAEAFLALLDRTLDEAILAGADPARWNGLLSAVRARAGADAPEAARLFEHARTVVGEAESRRQAARRLSVEKRLAALRSIGSSLAGAFQMPRLAAELSEGLARLGMGGGYLALFDGPGTEWARLAMAPAGTDARADAPNARFRTARLLPPWVGEAWRAGAWVLEPLTFQEERLGYLLLPGGGAEPAVYETLPEQVASAVKGALLLEQVRGHERRLEAEVERRTAELTRANAELTREVERRMRLEQEVGQISGRTMEKIGQDLHDDLCQHLAGVAMLTSVLHGRLSGADAAAAAALDQIGDLLADSISRAKQIARGLYPAGLEERGIVAAVEEMVDAARRRYPIHLEFRAAPDFRLPDVNKALQVYRIVQEALGNALKHSDSDRVEVRLYREEAGVNGGRERALVAEVTDFGSGLPAETPRDGMGLRIMRYRAESAGAELRVERLLPGTRVSCRVRAEHGET